ncbi:hypothetical protein BLNAU_11292 [Blattamonas nauphoetae]|uniref:Transcription factor IIIC putative zinc-finger domain-containing protein n=1 Tax=Blattamonas nauphoetae TaxID=2049346 RepID=A0ABQ9XQH5_9EUKA|nr:hypothetical protein BLNAU_11292 [Blattamonas nauphoetae]
MRTSSVRIFASAGSPNSLKWSKANQLAISTGNIINIFYPPSLANCRGSIEIERDPPYDIGPLYRKQEPHIDFLIRPTKEISASGMSWSPPGFGPNGTSLLLVTTNAGFATVYQCSTMPMVAAYEPIVSVSGAWYSILCDNVKDATVPKNVDEHRHMMDHLFISCGCWAPHSPGRIATGTLLGTIIFWEFVPDPALIQYQLTFLAERQVINEGGVTCIEWDDLGIVIGGSDGSVWIMNEDGEKLCLQSSDLRTVTTITVSDPEAVSDPTPFVDLSVSANFPASKPIHPCLLDALSCFPSYSATPVPPPTEPQKVGYLSHSISTLSDHPSIAQHFEELKSEPDFHLSPNERLIGVGRGNSVALYRVARRAVQGHPYMLVSMGQNHETHTQLVSGMCFSIRGLHSVSLDGSECVWNTCLPETPQERCTDLLNVPVSFRRSLSHPLPFYGLQSGCYGLIVICLANVDCPSFMSSSSTVSSNPTIPSALSISSVPSSTIATATVAPMFTIPLSTESITQQPDSPYFDLSNPVENTIIGTILRFITLTKGSSSFHPQSLGLIHSLSTRPLTPFSIRLINTLEFIADHLLPTLERAFQNEWQSKNDNETVEACAAESLLQMGNNAPSPSAFSPMLMGSTPMTYSTQPLEIPTFNQPCPFAALRAVAPRQSLLDTMPPVLKMFLHSSQLNAQGETALSLDISTLTLPSEQRTICIHLLQMTNTLRFLSEKTETVSDTDMTSKRLFMTETLLSYAYIASGLCALLTKQEWSEQCNQLWPILFPRHDEMEEQDEKTISPPDVDQALLSTFPQNETGVEQILPEDPQLIFLSGVLVRFVAWLSRSSRQANVSLTPECPLPSFIFHEPCPFCHNPITFTRLCVAECEKNHLITRCLHTLSLTQTPSTWCCPVCLNKSALRPLTQGSQRFLEHVGIGAGFRHEPAVPSGFSDLLSLTPSCIYCGQPMVWIW